MEFLIALAGVLFVGGVSIAWLGVRKWNDDRMAESRISVHRWRSIQRQADGLTMFLFVLMLLLATIWGDYRA